MDYENFDWELEAKRVARAFGVEDECEFRRKKNEFGERYNLLCGGRNNLAVGEILDLYVRYSPQGMWFKLQGGGVHTWVLLDYRAQLLRSGMGLECPELLIQGLFRLGLLTSEVETALESGVTTHQKMEWALEYENEQYEL